MILIADSGSTKTTWSLLDNRKEKIRFETEGYNPYFVTGNYIASSLYKSIDKLVNTSQIEAVYFYGAGCDADRANIVKESLKHVFWCAEVFVHSDLLAAARGVLGTEPGFAAILGTGSNTCLYNGKDVSMNIDSLGFILGDEGSGAFLGKKILQDYLRNTMPPSVKQRFHNTYELKNDEVIYRVYSLPLANRYCASFCKFLSADCTYSVGIVKAAFRQFFFNLVCLYPDYRKYSFNCVGSVGYVFKSLLEEVAGEFNLQTKNVVQSPMDGLVDYHLNLNLL